MICEKGVDGRDKPGHDDQGGHEADRAREMRKEAINSIVMRGLDPRIHAALQQAENQHGSPGQARR
jgi:hypothetical protein